MSQPYKITGLHGVYPRLEIRKLFEDDIQFTLFIYALHAIKQPDYRPKPARFQDIGGIHGLPYERWSGDPDAPDALPEGIWGGYCNHQCKNLSLTRYTVKTYYIATGYQQSVGEAAIRLARRWTEDTEHVSEDVRKTWTESAKRLRFPYWDWTDKSTETEGLPDVLKPQVFQYTLPDGTLSDPIENPLAFHDFGSVQPDGFEDEIFQTSMARGGAMSFFKSWSRTYRWPSSKVNPIEDYVKINKILRGSAETRGSAKQLREQIGRLFCYPAPGETVEHQRPSIWDEFSNTLFKPGKAGWDGFGCGGLGAMANNDYAGYDPIFYLHHCNIDRILAFWEYTYHKYWVGMGYYKKDGDGEVIPFTQPEGTWDEKNNAPINQKTGLQPFRTETGEYWTPDQTRFFNKSSTLETGYTYPDIVAEVNGKQQRVSLTNRLPETDQQVHECKAILQSHFGVCEKGSLAGLHLKKAADDTPIPEGHHLVRDYQRFYTFVELVGHAFNGSYSLQLLFKERVIASFAVLSRGDATQCASCRVRKKAGGQVRGIVDIPDEVVQEIINSRSEELSTADDLVETLASFIKESLSVRLIDAGGNLLADAVARPGVPGIRTVGGEGSRLEEAITPVVHLRSARAVRKVDDSVVVPARGQLPKMGLTFFDHSDHGDLIGGQEWKTI
ncbi:hypothetical protein H1R20_g5021, partial [Candolleomyces eurysporus]